MSNIAKLSKEETVLVSGGNALKAVSNGVAIGGSIGIGGSILGVLGSGVLTANVGAGALVGGIVIGSVPIVGVCGVAGGVVGILSYGTYKFLSRAF